MHAMILVPSEMHKKHCELSDEITIINPEGAFRNEHGSMLIAAEK